VTLLSRAPHETGPITGNVRRQFTPSWLSRPFSRSLIGTVKLVTPLSDASVPAGAFHTPRETSVRAQSPASIPPGGTSRGTPAAAGSAMVTLGK
jgi:hypothetical protein